MSHKCNKRHKNCVTNNLKKKTIAKTISWFKKTPWIQNHQTSRHSGFMISFSILSSYFILMANFNIGKRNKNFNFGGLVKFKVKLKS